MLREEGKIRVQYLEQNIGVSRVLYVSMHGDPIYAGLKPPGIHQPTPTGMTDRFYSPKQKKIRKNEKIVSTHHSLPNLMYLKASHTKSFRLRSKSKNTAQVGKKYVLISTSFETRMTWFNGSGRKYYPYCTKLWAKLRDRLTVELRKNRVPNCETVQQTHNHRSAMGFLLLSVEYPSDQQKERFIRNGGPHSTCASPMHLFLAVASSDDEWRRVIKAIRDNVKDESFLDDIKSPRPLRPNDDNYEVSTKFPTAWTEFPPWSILTVVLFLCVLLAVFCACSTNVPIDKGIYWEKMEAQYFKPFERNQHITSFVCPSGSWR